MTRNYLDYTIQVTPIESDLGKGYRAEFFVKKDNGLKANIHAYEIYDNRLRPKDVIEQVKHLITNCL